MAFIHSPASCSDWRRSQVTLLLGLVPTATSCASPAPEGRSGLSGMLAVYCPAAIRSGERTSLAPPSMELLSPPSYQARTESLYRTSSTSFQVLPNHRSVMIKHCQD